MEIYLCVIILVWPCNSLNILRYQLFLSLISSNFAQIFGHKINQIDIHIHLLEIIFHHWTQRILRITMFLLKKFPLISYIIAAIRYLKGKLINIKIRNSKKSIFRMIFAIMIPCFQLYYTLCFWKSWRYFDKVELWLWRKRSWKLARLL